MKRVAIALEVQRPALIGTDALAYALPAVAVTIDVTVLELDPSPLGRFGDDAHLDLTAPARVRLPS